MSDRHSVPRSQVQAQPQPVRPSPSLTPQTSYTGNVNQYTRPSSYNANQQTYHQNSTHNIPQQSAAPYQYSQQTHPTPIAAAHPGTYTPANAAINYNRPAPTAVQPMQYQAQQTNGSTLRGAETYVLSDPANASIPREIREQFPTDDQGRLLFFTQPPLNTQHVVSGSSEAEKGQPLRHSERYMKTLALRKRKAEEQLAESMEVDEKATTGTKSELVKGIDTNAPAEHGEIPQGQITARATSLLAKKMKQSTYKEYQDCYGDDWRKVLLADLDYQKLCFKDEIQKEQLALDKRRKLDQSNVQENHGQFSVNPQGYITGWQKDFFVGSYLDDYDSRLP